MSSTGKSKAKASKQSTKSIDNPIDPVAEIIAEKDSIIAKKDNIIAKKDDIIGELNEKIRLLNLENETLRIKSPTPSSASFLTPAKQPRKNSSIKNQLATPGKQQRNNSLSSTPAKPPRKNSVAQTRERLESNLSITSIKKEKGCSCKGRCASKICGCVKKEQKCTENCKCTEACENNDNDVFDGDDVDDDDNKENSRQDNNDNDNDNDNDNHDDDDNDNDNSDEEYDDNEDKIKIKSESSSRSTALTTSGSYASRSSLSSQSENEVDFNPMKPTKTLARSPLSNKSSMSPLNEVKKSPLQTVDDNERIIPNIDGKINNKSEIEGPNPTVNWEQHQNQLKPCSKCGRKFFPDRLPIHERSCLKI